MDTNVAKQIQEIEVIHESPARESLRRLIHHRSAQVGMIILGIMILCAIFAKQIAPYSPTEILDNVTRRAGPCIHLFGCPADQTQHLFGIDGNSRDLFSRVIYGSRLSLQIGLATIGFAIIIGGLIGAVAGFLGGWIDDALMRTMDVLMAFPSLLLAIAIVSALGTGLINALLAIGIVSIPRFARLVRSTVLTIKEQDFIVAARSIGAQQSRLLFRHILPNSWTPLIVQGTLGIATAILDAAALSFLGLGAQPPTPEWGSMLGEEKNSIFNAPHLVIFPGVALMLTVLAFNLLGDGLRDALDPRLRGTGAG
jgi:ABC-type dipeptide/oligopeptide/nickel transport system permease subunit